MGQHGFGNPKNYTVVTLSPPSFPAPFTIPPIPALFPLPLPLPRRWNVKQDVIEDKIKLCFV